MNTIVSTSDGWTLTNRAGASVRLLNYGATVTHLSVPDAQGRVGDVILGYEAREAYERHSPYFGSVVGRVGNRIARGQFTLDGRSYPLATNNGPHHLHGGTKGYDKRVWLAQSADTRDGPAVQFTLRDPDGTEGYPGTVDVTVTYTLTDRNALALDYAATTDAATPINLTNHAYFNLRDAGASPIDQHVVQIHADAYTPADATLIPTGAIAPVAGTPFDFTAPKPIAPDFRKTGLTPEGYDHNFVLRGQSGTLAHAVTVSEPNTGRTMEVWTTQPGVQFYTGNFLDGTITGKSGTVYRQHAGFCLETQHYPDAVHHPQFPSVILCPREVYRQRTEYRFGIV